MIRAAVISVTVSLVCAACAAPPPDSVTEQSVARYMAAAASIGCVLRYDSDYIPVEFQAGLTREQSLEITTYMLSTDKAVRLPEGGVKLTTGACA